jgi:hypothetical protein
MFSPDAVTLRKDDVAWQFVDESVVVLDLRSSSYIEVNPSGAVLFRMLVDGSDVKAMALSLSERYGLPADEAEEDVKAFLAVLADKGLLT